MQAPKAVLLDASLTDDAENPTLWVLTDKCLDLEPESHCETDRLGEAITSGIELSFTSAPDSLWNLGQRMNDCIGLPVAEWELRDIAYDKPLSDVRIHCGPCACAIHTAISLCSSKDVSLHYRFSIHVHDRLPTSCRRASSPVEVMEAFRDGLEGFQLTDKYDRLQKALSYIDSPSLEQRIYDLEQELFEPVSPENVLQAVLVDVLEEQQRSKQYRRSRSLGADIFIVEADTCQLSLQHPPFKAQAKKPKATNIFELSRPPDQGSKQQQSSRPHQITQRYIGSYYRSKGAIRRRTSEVSRVPLEIPSWDLIQD